MFDIMKKIMVNGIPKFAKQNIQSELRYSYCLQNAIFGHFF